MTLSRSAGALLCGAILSAPLAAQSLSLRVVDGDGQALGLTSVLIRTTVRDSATVQRRLTSASGTLQVAVAAGQVTVIARRVGFRADSVQLRPESIGVPVTLRLVRVPQLLETMLVRESQDCALSTAEADAGDLTLWDEVVKGIEARRLVRDVYRYERRYRRVITRDPRFGGSTDRITDTLEVNDPSVRDTTTAFRTGAYTVRRGNALSIRVFDEGDLTSESFLRLHCHGAPWRDTTDASVRISFSPRRSAKAADDAALVRGTVVMDGATWMMRAVSYDYVRNGKSVGQGRVEYAPVTVDGSVVAMPTRMTGDIRVSGRFGLGSLLVLWTIDQSHTAFSRVVGSAADKR